MNLHHRSVVVASTLLLLAACSSSGPASSSEETTGTSPPSFACIQANAATGLNSGSTVDRARQNLKALIADPSSTQLEADYFSELLVAIDERAGTDVVGDAFDAVRCDLV